MEFPCLFCQLEVYDTDMAICCDSCGEWSHISCETGIDIPSYQAMMRGEKLLWSCLVCRTNAEELRPSNLAALRPIREIIEDDIVIQLESPRVEILSPLTYRQISSGTSRKGDLLSDSRGHSYVRNVDNRRAAIRWKCIHKNRPVLCKAEIVEDGHSYIRTPIGRAHDHICDADPLKVKYVEMRTRVLERGVKDHYLSAASIIDDELINDG